MDTNSGIIIEEAASNESFSDFTPIPCNGFNIICKAKRYGRWWVLKGLKEQYSQQETYRNLLKKEFDILVSLQHPNIVGTSSFEYVEGLGNCIVMEWIDGITLQQWIDRGKGKERKGQGKESSKARTAAGRKLFMQLLDAIVYVHAKQIVHRDLKPSNIMVTHNGGNIKLIDFGLADTDSYTILKQPAGTPGYISPEQASSRQTDIRNDIFSIGCILEKMQLGKEYDAVIKRCKCDIEKRFASAEEIKERIAYINEKKSRKKRAIAYVAIAAAIVAAILLYYRKPAIDNERKPAGKELQPTHDTISIRTKTYNSADMPEPQKGTSRNSDEAAAQLMVSEGKKAIDKMWQEAGIDTIRHATEKSEALYKFVDRSNDFITTIYPNSLGNSIAGSQKTYIISELSAYASEKYIKPTVEKLQSDT